VEALCSCAWLNCWLLEGVTLTLLLPAGVAAKLLSCLRQQISTRTLQQAPSSAAVSMHQAPACSISLSLESHPLCGCDLVIPQGSMPPSCYNIASTEGSCAWRDYEHRYNVTSCCRRHRVGSMIKDNDRVVGTFACDNACSVITVCGAQVAICPARRQGMSVRPPMQATEGWSPSCRRLFAGCYTYSWLRMEQPARSQQKHASRHGTATSTDGVLFTTLCQHWHTG
jgi:hypothetical protein